MRQPKQANLRIVEFKLPAIIVTLLLSCWLMLFIPAGQAQAQSDSGLSASDNAGTVASTGHTHEADAPDTASGYLEEGSLQAVPLEAEAASESCVNALVVEESQTVTNATWKKDVYVPRGATLTLSGTTTITGDVYVQGTLNTSGTVKVEGTLHCLHYGSMFSAGSYSYGYVNNSGRLNATSMDVTGSWLSVPIPAIRHENMKETEEDVVEAACDTSGSYTLVKSCADCGVEFSRTSVSVPALGHDFASETVAQQPTCTTAGIERSTCSRCGSIRDIAIPALGHDYGSERVTQQPTCTVAGVKHSTCSRCGDAHDETIPALGHTAAPVAQENASRPTCTATGGYDNVTRCSICNEELTRTHVELAALGHKWSAWSKTRKPTTTKTGRSERTCAHCGAVEAKPIAKLKKAVQAIKVSKTSWVFKGSKYVKLQKLKKAQKITLKTTAKGKITFQKLSGNASISVGKSGKVTLRKGLKTGTYRVLVKANAAATARYKTATKTLTLIVKVAR